jgi:hypothetical protein
MFLRRTLHRLTLPVVTPPPIPVASAGASQPPPGALDETDGQPLGKHVKGVFRCWMILFALVGSQMGWVLRPFIGDPNTPVTFFRERHANFFAGVWGHLINLFQ